MQKAYHQTLIHLITRIKKPRRALRVAGPKPKQRPCRRTLAYAVLVFAECAGYVGGDYRTIPIREFVQRTNHFPRNGRKHGGKGKLPRAALHQHSGRREAVTSINIGAYLHITARIPQGVFMRPFAIFAMFLFGHFLFTHK